MAACLELLFLHATCSPVPPSNAAAAAAALGATWRALALLACARRAALHAHTSLSCHDLLSSHAWPFSSGLLTAVHAPRGSPALASLKELGVRAVDVSAGFRHFCPAWHNP